jgi:hypothetical protein
MQRLSSPRKYVRENDRERAQVAEDKINRPGSDCKNFETDGWTVCEAACAEDGICSSWTMRTSLRLRGPGRSHAQGGKLNYLRRRAVPGTHRGSTRQLP